jgi:hypothetical protein
MKDITLIEIKELTRNANESILFTKHRFPYLDVYETLNEAIFTKAKNGENSISFDFVDNLEDEINTIGEIKRNHNRIYLSHEGGQAMYNVYDYPNYLNSRGFNVEIRKKLKQHGYTSKSYYISW